MSIANRQAKLLEELSFFQDWTERYEYVIDLGKKLTPMPQERQTEDKLIKGCQSQVWLDADFDGETITYLADSDSLITKGMIALFVRTMDGATPAEVLAADMSFVEQTGLKEHLAPTRANALNLMTAQMKKHAMNFATGE